MPFHALLTTYFGTTFGGLLIWKAWKDILLFFLALIAFYLALHDKRLQKRLRQQSIWRWMALFIVWQVIAVLLGVYDLDAMLSGFVMQVRAFVLFFVGYVAAWRGIFGKQPLLLYALILVPSTIVALFAILQVTVLSPDFLVQFGYHKVQSIPPYFTIDNQLDHLRAFSTTRGPNMLGAYLLIPMSALLIAIRKLILSKKRPLFISSAVLLLIVHLGALYASHSRGAWVGTLVVAFCFTLFVFPQRFRKQLLALIGILLLSMAAVLYMQRSSSFVQNVILHDNPETGGVQSSNEERLAAFAEGIESLKDDPLTGCGAGCAGPASVRHEAGAKIAENHYIQTAQESGVIGLLLLLVVYFFVIRWLWQYRNEPVALLLTLSFVGICVTSMFSHVWTDDLVTYLWWGLAGIFFGGKQKESSTLK